MMKQILTIWIVALCSFLPCAGQLIKIGDKVPMWVLEDADKNPYSIDFWAGKVLQIAYVDPDNSDLNDELNDFISDAFIAGKLDTATYMGFGIVDCKSTIIPNGLIRKIAGNKAKKYHTVALFDYDAKLQNIWGLPKDSYSTIIIDKDKICRGIYTGKVDKGEYERILQILIEYTSK